MTFQTRQTDKKESGQKTPQYKIFAPGIILTKCPIRASLGVLGRKWTLLILRDMELRKIDRFNQLLKSIPGLSPRVLSMRLRQLEAEGFIESMDRKEASSGARWLLTKKGKDTLPILIQFILFGSKWYADEVFIDKKPRNSSQLFKPNVMKMMGTLSE
jgi:DNA-binding HxlR family transcriptional regulator